MEFVRRYKKERKKGGFRKLLLIFRYYHILPYKKKLIRYFEFSMYITLSHSEKKVIPAIRNLRTNSVSTIYYKVVIYIYITIVNK